MLNTVVERALNSAVAMKTRDMAMNVLRVNRIAVVGLVIAIVIVILYFLRGSSLAPQVYESQNSDYATGNKYKYIEWPEFSPVFPHDYEWYERKCWPRTLNSMTNLHEIVMKLRVASNDDCKSLYKVFDAIYSVTNKPANAVYPKTFAAKVRKWLGNSEQLMDEAYHQTITSVYNEYTNDNTNYNGLRDKRPVTQSGEDELLYIERIVNESRASCDFCNYNYFTAEDSFGRVKGKLSYTAANAFRWDQWHSLIIPATHHPLRIMQEEFLDVMATNEKWQMTVYNQQHEYKHPMVLWDMFLSGGASQLHPHLQAVMHMDKYYGAIENWRRAADRYTRAFPKHNYFHDLAFVHHALGLTVTYGEAVAFAHITPKKDYEIVVISNKARKDFYLLLYYAIRTYFDEMGKYAFSMAIAFPTMSPLERRGVLPAYARLVSRGPVKATRSDIGSLELLTASSVNTDPYKLIENIKRRIDSDKTKQ